MTFARLHYMAKQRHDRWRRRVEARKPPLVCQECGGTGGDPADAWSYTPPETCGWCEGIGLVDDHRRGEWLAWRKTEAAGVK